MGVQIRVAGAAVPMGKRGSHKATYVDLPDPLRPFPGKQGVSLQEPERIVYGCLVGLFDLGGDLLVGDRP